MRFPSRRGTALALLALLILTVPLAFSLHTSQLFAAPKAALFLVLHGALLIVLSLGVLHRPSDLHKRYMLWTMIALAAGVASTITGLSPITSLLGSGERHMGLLIWILLALLPIGIALLHPTKRERRLFVYLPILLIGSLEAAIAVLQHIHPPLLFAKLVTADFLGRSFGTLGHPQMLGVILVFPACIGLGMAARQGAYRWMAAAAALLSIVGIILSGTRAALLGVLIGYAVVILPALRPRVRIALLLIGCGLGISSLFIREDGLRSIHARAALWQSAIAAIAERPLLGYGPDQQADALSPHITATLWEWEDPLTVPDRAHTLVLDTLLQTGLLGTTSLMIVLYLILQCAMRRPITAERRMLLGSLLACFASWQLGFITIADGMLFAIIAGLLLGDETPHAPVHPPRIARGFTFAFAVVTFLLASRLVSAQILMRSAQETGNKRMATLTRTLQPWDERLLRLSVNLDAETDDSIASFLRLRPYHGPALLHAAKRASLRGDHTEADRLFAPAEMRLPASLLYWHERAAHERRTGRIEEEQDALRSLLALAPPWWNDPAKRKAILSGKELLKEESWFWEDVQRARELGPVTDR